jgi:histidyl-tRNA synthetase
VRGLDYYTRTTFEVLSGELGAQNSVLGGGRYDGLVSDLGGPDVTGIGFALGMERLVMLLPSAEAPSRCDVFLAVLAAGALDRALALRRELRRADLAVLMEEERGLKAQMKRADKLGARYAVLFGEDELRKGAWTVRDMNAGQQQEVPDSDIATFLEEKCHG